jgi:tyrosyl-tRNA synthetase
MSIPDALMWSYYQLCTDLPPGDIVKFQQAVNAGKLHPMEAKMGLARLIVAGFRGPAAAKKAAEEFRRVFREHQAPEEAPVRKLPRCAPKRLVALLVEVELAPSRSEAERLVKQGGVEIDGARVSDVRKEVDLSRPSEFLLRAGKKRFLRVVVE